MTKRASLGLGLGDYGSEDEDSEGASPVSNHEHGMPEPILIHAFVNDMEALGGTCTNPIVLYARAGFSFAGLQDISSSPITTQGAVLETVEAVQQSLAEAGAPAEPEATETPAASPTHISPDRDSGLQDQSLAVDGQQQGDDLDTQEAGFTQGTASALPAVFSRPPSTTGTPERARCPGKSRLYSKPHQCNAPTGYGCKGLQLLCNSLRQAPSCCKACVQELLVLIISCTPVCCYRLAFTETYK